MDRRSGPQASSGTSCAAVSTRLRHGASDQVSQRRPRRCSTSRQAGDSSMRS
nr:hypothetical protein [Duganella sp. Leaf126]